MSTTPKAPPRSSSSQASSSTATDEAWTTQAFRKPGHTAFDPKAVGQRARAKSSKSLAVLGGGDKVTKAPKKRKITNDEEVYQELLRKLGLRAEHSYPYVPGHCFFSSIARSSSYVDVPEARQDCSGARVVRLVISWIFGTPSRFGALRPNQSAHVALEQCPYFKEPVFLQQCRERGIDPRSYRHLS